jgi:hypothetical protein
MPLQLQTEIIVEMALEMGDEIMVALLQMVVHRYFRLVDHLLKIEEMVVL